MKFTLLSYVYFSFTFTSTLCKITTDTETSFVHNHALALFADVVCSLFTTCIEPDGEHYWFQ